VEAWLTRGSVRTAIGLNTWQGVEYVDRDAFATILRWAVRLDAIDGDGVAPPRGRPGTKARPSEDLVSRLSAAAEAAGYRVDRLRAALDPGPTGSRSVSPAAAGPAGSRRTTQSR
jgi:hypothetical protein